MLGGFLCPGYDVNGGPQSPKPGGMITQGLSSSRELVEQLEPEPLYDYLVQNGVLSEESIKDLQQERSPAKTNLSLLRQVEETGKPGEGLLLIALRQSGQHHLANLLDDTGRIKALSGSGYLSKSRHKGQLSLKIVLRAVKLAPDSLRSSTGELLHSREWLSVDDFTPQPVNGNHDNSIPQFELEVEEEQKSSCLCGCFKIFSKKKVKKVDNNKNATKYADNDVISRSSSKHIHAEKLANLENIFKGKATEFYSLLTQRTNGAHVELLKYFEQDRSLLVLDSTCDVDGMTIITISTTAQQFHTLRKDYNSARLTADIERTVVTEEVLSSLGATGLKVYLEASPDELEQVDVELS